MFSYRTVVAYQNPFTGDYCVHKSRAGPKGYMNNMQPDSPDSGVSDEYEPLNLEPLGPQPKLPHVIQDQMPPGLISMPQVRAILLSMKSDHRSTAISLWRPRLTDCLTNYNVIKKMHYMATRLDEINVERKYKRFPFSDCYYYLYFRRVIQILILFNLLKLQRLIKG